MIGWTEATIIGVAFLVVVLFGRKTYKKGLRDIFSLRKDYNEIKQEFDEDVKKVRSM